MTPTLRDLAEDAFAYMEIVGTGGAAYLAPGVYLAGGNVAEHMRGRGIYRA